MNKSNRTFKKLIDKHHDATLKKAQTDFWTFLAKQLDAQSLYVIHNTNDENLKIINPDLAEKFKSLKKVFNKDYLPTFRENMHGATAIQKAYQQTDTSFHHFQELKWFLDKFNFSDSKRADVLAYFLNININYALPKSMTEDELILYVQHLINEKLASDTISDEYPKKKRGDLNQLISKEGDLLPCAHAKDYLWVFSKISFLLDYEDVVTIVEESEKRALALTQKSTNLIQTTSFEQEKRTCKEQKEAAQLLKQYIVDGIPTRYLTSTDLLEMNESFVLLNYTDEEIARIQKNIIANNRKIEEEASALLFETSKNKFLSEQEKEILTIASDIIEYDLPIKNNFYTSVCEIYTELKTKLINALNMSYDSSKVDEQELLIIEVLCDLEDLTNAVTNYTYSDYKFCLNRKKQESDGE